VCDVIVATLRACLQDIFECRTCGLVGSLCCCTECARICHKGHDCKSVFAVCLSVCYTLDTVHSVITARVARMYRFCLVCVCVSGFQKLIISSLHNILHSPGGGLAPIQACPFVRLGPGVCTGLFTPFLSPSSGGLCDPALS